MRHLARVRLSTAAGHLATTSASIRQIARQAGYDNEASLSKAFKREFGIPPGRYRTRALSTRPADASSPGQPARESRHTDPPDLPNPDPQALQLDPTS